ncbi:hypothetical protein ACWF94_20600 [Streptomyces sp. NPDC055078]
MSTPALILVVGPVTVLVRGLAMNPVMGMVMDLGMAMNPVMVMGLGMRL